jgi:hypothetical protein
MITAITGANSDITLTNVTFSDAVQVKITADNLTFGGLTGIVDTLSVNTIKADGAQKLNLAAGRQHKVSVSQAAESGKITVLIVSTDGKALKNNTVIFSSFKGDKFDVDLENAGFRLVRTTGQFKVTMVQNA